jgi:hypothetical protein
VRTKILFLAATLLPMLTLHAIVDTNDNGLSDIWEKQFNKNELFSETFDPEADPDSDGWTNAQEAAAGTDPVSTAHPLGHLQPETVQLPETWVDTDNDNIPDSLVYDSIQVSWPTIPGKQYTFQSNATLAPDNWINVGSPFIGTGTVVTYGFFTSAAATTFWRVNITDIDSDGDTLNNWEENELGTNPLHSDSDGDGLSDGWEITNGLDANDDRDRDGVLNSVDADADEPLIDWQPSARPVFAVIELDVTDVENLILDDLTETGTILLTNDTTTPNTRILVDRWQKVITFPASGEGGPSAFSSNGPTLIGDTLPGERIINNFSKGYLMIPEMNGTQSFQPWENPTNYLDSIKDSRNGTTIAVNWLGPNPNWTNPGLGRFPDGNPLPNEESTASTSARIEADGNIVSDKVYWRKDLQTGNPGNAIPIPSVPTAVHSATVTQVTTGPTGAIEENHWNLVATHQGLLVSKNDGNFTSASGALAGVACDGVTRQGWIIDRTNQRIRSNGEWKTLLQLLGDGFSQAELLGILDTGLAVAKVKSSEPEADFKLALLVPVEVAVDADRDGEITFDGKDKTTAEKPFRFWINDDVDKGNTVDGNDYEEDDLNESAKDSEDGKLNFRRDLEDLTRLWIDFSGINSVFPASDPSVALKVRIEADAGSPVINLYQPVETDGGREYLKDENTGYNQLQGIYGQQLCQITSAAIVVPRRAWETLPTDKVVHLLFEGATEGNGKLIFEIWKDGEKKCDLPSVHLNLKKAKDMYETWTVGDVDAAGVDFTKWPAASATQTSGQNIPLPEKPEEKDYIMFVHGWNMPPWEKETFASTMFKRMWHQGFKGRFGAFRWPTFYGLSGPSWGNLKGENIHTAHFDGSEQRAWNSASALKNLLIGRESVFGTNKIRLYAHSMGNIVSSEALRQMAPSSHVNTYISAQAAVSSHVWDKTTPQMTFNSPLGLNTPNVYGYYWQSTAYLPPHNWQNEGRPSYMDPQYMPSGTTYINHYNPLDWALSYDNWQLNQVLKPDVDYNYGWPALDFIDISLRFWKTQSIPPFRNLTFSNDRFEVFSYAAQSHGYATGQQGATAGKFNVAFSVNLLGEYGFESAHKGHSAQFRSTIQKRWTYWERALEDMQINLPTP